VCKALDPCQDVELKVKGEMFVVVQNGGSSAEWYAIAFDTLEDAQAFIDDCDMHTYNCVGPYAMPSLRRNRTG